MRGVFISLVLAAAGAMAQPNAKGSAPTETSMEGYWVAQVTEDWRWRMVTPPKGDYASIPLTLAGKRKADTWDPARDTAAGEQCRAYGAPGVMRMPTRLHITWADNETLKVETDAGQQTRLLHFGNWPAPKTPPTWQGDSRAEWQLAGRPPAKFGTLKVVTNRMRPGYLRKNGVPYTADAVLTEYWDTDRLPDGTPLLIVTTLVHDPEYLQLDWATALHFKKEPDGSKWQPEACSATW